jgi:hypothetical protein
MEPTNYLSRQSSNARQTTNLPTAQKDGVAIRFSNSIILTWVTRHSTKAVVPFGTGHLAPTRSSGGLVLPLGNGERVVFKSVSGGSRCHKRIAAIIIMGKARHAKVFIPVPFSVGVHVRRCCA